MKALPHAAIRPWPSVLAAAPHRLLFLAGAVNVMAAMTWWTLWMLSLRWHLVALPSPPIPPGWAHAFIMAFQVFTPFIFGFALTVFPRWMGQAELDRWHYLPVGAGLFGGQLLVLVGLWGFEHLVHLGVMFTIVGWASGLFSLGGVLWRDGLRSWHGISVFFALVSGWCALLMFALWLHRPGDAMLVFAAFKIAPFAFLLPVYLSVVHRMLPFFANNAVPGYTMWRPQWVLPAMWVMLMAHVVLELMHGYAWLWLADLPLLALGSLMVWKMWPRGAIPGLLRVLFIALAWFPVAMALFVAQSLWFAWSGEFVLGRAPMHALAIGFFGSMLVAMVTRVTQGHSGRLLVMPVVGWIAFWGVQLAALTRLAAELRPDYWAWQVFAGALWLAAFLPWVLRSAWIYLTPRADRRPG